MKQTPNIVFVSVDALRQDRMSVYGYERPTTPNLERLAAQSAICRNHFALNASTVGAFPTILCSSRPLSYGGFDNGGVGRPPSVFSQLNAAGYETYMMSTVHWVNRFFGYGEGVDVEEMLFSLSSLIGITGALTRTSLERYNDGELSVDELLTLIGPVVERSFARLDMFADERKRHHDADKRDFRYAPFFADGYDYRRIKESIEQHRQLYHADPAGYVAKYMPQPFGATGWLSKVWRTQRHPARLIEETFYQTVGKLISAYDARTGFLLQQRYKRYADADALVEHILRTAEARTSDKPFFMWTHLFDTHLPYCPGAHPKWYKNASHHLRACGYDPKLNPATVFHKSPTTKEGWEDWSALYDAAVHFVDNAIGRLAQGLEDAGLLDNTIIVICGDHGEELGENNDSSHHFRLYEYTTHVPLMILGASIEARNITDFTSHLDIAPTLASLTNAPSHPNWEGRSVLDTEIADRDHVLMETFFGSPCDFERRPLYLAVRDSNFHFMWKEYRDPTDRLSPNGQQLYDINRDPLQKRNIYDASHPSVVAGEKIIAQRLRELPEVSSERIDRNFSRL